MAEETKAVHVELVIVSPVRHPIKAARLLYRAPAAVLRGPIYLVFLIVFSFMTYSFWAKKDELVTAPLKLERESNTVESISGGMVNQVFVKEGDMVEAGTQLMTVTEIRRASTSEDQLFQGQEIDLTDKLRTLEDEYKHNRNQLDLSLKELRNERQVMTEKLAQAERNVLFLEGKVKEAKEKYGVEERLFRNRDITKAEFDGAKNNLDVQEKALADARSEVSNTKVRLNSLGEAQEHKLQNDIAQAEDRFKSQSEQIKRQLSSTQEKSKEKLVVGVEQKDRLTTYSSTFSGLVTRVGVKPGQNVAVGTSLITVVKESAALEARVLVENKDIGRLKKGQTVQIKYFAYPYQEYGIPEGTISEIATKPGGVEGETTSAKYIVRVALHDETVRKMGGKPKPLEIGLEGFAEIKVGEKRFIELMFSPISKFFAAEED